MKFKPFIFLCLSLFLLGSVGVHAQSVKLKQDRKARLEQEIAILDRQIKENKSKNADAMARLSLIQSKIAARQALVDESNREISGIEEKISAKQAEIDAIQARLDTVIMYSERLVRSAYKNRDARVWYMYILASENLSQGLRRYSFFKNLSSKMNAQAEAIKRTREELQSEKAAMDIFFRMDMGITIGAMGGNEQVVTSQGINPQTLKVIGLGFSNALIGFSGGLLAQYQGFADVNLGTGMLVQGLASIMLGEFLFSTNKISLLTLQVVFGSLIYKALMYLGRSYGYVIGITANDFKLLTGVLVIISLLVAQSRSKAADNTARKKAMERLGIEGGEGK